LASQPSFAYFAFAPRQFRVKTHPAPNPARSRKGLPMFAYNPFVWLALQILNIYWWIVIAAVVVSWLVAFGVINTYHRFVRALVQGLDALTDPLFRQVRRIIPPLGGLDISPLIVLIAIQFLMYLIEYYS
jgi:YggT family protein